MVGPAIFGLTIAGFIFAIAIAFLYLLVMGFFLRFGIRIFNGIAGIGGTAEEVPRPSSMKALLIAFVVLVCAAIFHAILSLVLGSIAPIGDDEKTNYWLLFISMGISSILSYFLSGVLLSALLPTPILRALGVALCWFVPILIIYGSLAALFVLFILELIAGMN